VRTTNRHFHSLMGTTAGAALMSRAGWRRENEEFYYVDSVEALRSALHDIEEHLASASLMNLPTEVLASIGQLLDVGSLCALRRTSRTAKALATRGSLWLCASRYGHTCHSDWPDRTPILTSTPTSPVVKLPAAAVHRLDSVWFAVARMESLWARLEARCCPALRHTLRDELSLAALAMTAERMPARLDRLPDALLASLLIHDGQVPCPGEIGLFFGGARLLCLEELLLHGSLDAPKEPRAATSPCHSSSSAPSLDEHDPMRSLLPLTDSVGFMYLACHLETGAVVLVSGFNVTTKARSFASFLELVLHDTV